MIKKVRLCSYTVLALSVAVAFLSFPSYVGSRPIPFGYSPFIETGSLGERQRSVTFALQFDTK